MGILTDVVDLIRHLGDALENLTYGLQMSVRRSYETFDYIAARRAKIALTKIHKYGTEVGVMQSQVPARFLCYLNDPSPERWADVQKDLSRVLSGLPEIAEEAAKAHSAFVLEDIYKSYIITIKSRKDLITKLLESPPPSTEEEKAALSQVASEYIRLMDMLESCQCGLSMYIKSKFPDKKHDLSMDELPDAIVDKRSVWNDPPRVEPVINPSKKD